MQLVDILIAILMFVFFLFLWAARRRWGLTVAPASDQGFVGCEVGSGVRNNGVCQSSCVLSCIHYQTASRWTGTLASSEAPVNSQKLEPGPPPPGRIQFAPSKLRFRALISIHSSPLLSGGADGPRRISNPIAVHLSFPRSGTVVH